MSVLDLSQPLSISEILGSALSAIIDAQAQSARATVEFIKEVGILPGPADHEKLRTLTFRYQKLDENQRTAEFEAAIPLLGLVDIPMIAVKSATIAFAYEVTGTESSRSDDPSGAGGGAAGAVSGTGAVAAAGFLSKTVAPARLKGRVMKSPAAGATASSSASNSQEKGSIQIRVELEKAAMPVGIEKILDLLELSAGEKKAAVP
jgi:hypothetical protein